MADRGKRIDFGRVEEKRQVVADTRLVLGAERKVVGAEHRAEIDTIVSSAAARMQVEMAKVARIHAAGESQVQAVQKNTREVGYMSRWLEEHCRAAGIEHTMENRPFCNDQNCLIRRKE